MTQKKALRIIENYLKNHPLPVYDAMIDGDYDDKEMPVYSWRSLLAIAYDLKP